MQEERRKGRHLIIFTRALGGWARACTLGKWRGNRGKDRGNADRESKEKEKRWRKRGLKDWKGSRQEEGEIVAREENTKKGERQESIKVLHCWKKKKTLPSATIGLTFLWDTYVSARLSIKIKNYKLLSSVTLLGVTTWIWATNKVMAVGDGSVTANFAVTALFSMVTYGLLVVLYRAF